MTTRQLMCSLPTTRHTFIRQFEPPLDEAREIGTLHIFLPKKTDARIWWEASKTPISIALFTVAVTFIISWALANQVTQPLWRLGKQVDQIAMGDRKQIPPTPVDDEVRDLGNAINDMTAQLTDHEQRLRKNERLKNVVQFGNSIAHHLRNMTTGCKMAIELLAAKHSTLENSENYRVASRQLVLMDSYIQKFLLLSKSQEQSVERKTEELDMNDILENTLFLLRPNATHLGVSIHVVVDNDESLVTMHREDAEQMMMNLIGNAITAASEKEQDETKPVPPAVDIELSVAAKQFVLSVCDNGKGPPAEIADSIFHPFVSGRSEGTGIGLAVVADVANRIGGSVDWQRRDEATVFTFKSNSH